MSGGENGVQAFMKKFFLLAIYCIRITLFIILISLSFLSPSSKRQNVLNNEINKIENLLKKQKLISVYATRWEGRHKVIFTFLEL